MTRSLRAVLALAAFLLWPESLASLPGRYFRFERLFPGAAGAPVTGISSILQDREGYLWFGTIGGLARYDGYRFIFHSPPSGPGAAGTSGPPVVYPAIEDSRGEIWIGTDGQGLFRFNRSQGTFIQYRHDPSDPASVSGDIVLAIQEDRGGNLWVGTRLHGLNRFDRKTETFGRVPLDPAAGAIWDLLVDRSGSLWVGTQEGGLFRLDPGTGATRGFRFEAGHPRSLGSNTVWSIFQDRQGTIWVGTKGGGLNRFVPGSGDFDRLTGGPGLPRDLVSPPITAIAEDGAGRLWIGTSWDGLRIWDLKTGEYTSVKHDSQDPDSIADDNVTSILRDASGVMWVGTARGGINKCQADRVKFPLYKHNRFDPRSLSRNEVHSLWQDSSGRLWVGLDEGLDEFDERTGLVRRFRHEPSNGASLSPGAVLALCRDASGLVWAGTDGLGLDCLDPRTGRFEHYRSDVRNPASLSNNRVYVIWPDRADPGSLWVGTHQGLNRLDLRTRRFTRYLSDASDSTSLSGNTVTAIFDGRSGSLWVGTRWGLNRLDKSAGKFGRYLGDINAPPGTGPNDNVINCLHEDGSGILWVGTNNGLNRFDPVRGQWDYYLTKHGLPGMVVCGILEDESGFLWVSTNRGLARFAPRTGTFKAFGLHDGIQGHQFNGGACFRSGDGRMFFGGANGFNVFYPADVHKDSFVPPVVWTSFTRNNTEVMLPQSLSTLRNLTLPYKTPLVTFEFAALSFAAPEMNSFAFRLEPRDGEWISLVPDHRVSLFGMGAGRYTLRVRAANPDGVWNEDGIAIDIEVPAPFWRTWWFALIAAAFIASGALSVVRVWKKIKSSTLVAGESLDGIIETYELTGREREILRLVLQGASNKDIGQRLFISPSTVRNHVYNVYQKLGVRNRLELINRVGRDARESS